MKKILLITSLAAALWMSGCGSPATNAPAANTNANANANVSKPTATAPTADALFALDKQANDAYIKGDSSVFQTMLSDKAFMYEGGQRVDKASFLKMVAGTKCDVKESKLEDPQMSTIDADTAVLTYKATYDGTCTENGKTQKIPSPTRASTVYVRNGDKWQGVFHGENLIIDPKNPPPPPAADKKPEPKKEAPKKDDKAAANSNSAANTAAAPAKPVADANTDALVKIHTSGWEAFKAKDAKKFDEITSSNLAIVDPLGNYISGKSNVIKQWTETMKCEGITNVKVSDGFASALSPTVEALTLKGTADGKCDGHKNGDLYQTAFYVKEGDAWKLVFMFESPAMGSM